MPDGKSSYARAVLMGMGVGDIIILEPKDWTQKTRKPGTYCLRLGRKTGRQWTCRTVADGSGWMVERIR